MTARACLGCEEKTEDVEQICPACRGAGLATDGKVVRVPIDVTLPSTLGQRRPSHYDLADLHSYVVPVPPKSLLETLSVTEFALQELERQRPGYNAGGTIDSHLKKIQLLMAECQRKRPTGRGGKHGDLHTPECGCKGRAL